MRRNVSRRSAENYTHLIFSHDQSSQQLTSSYVPPVTLNFDLRAWRRWTSLLDNLVNVLTHTHTNRPITLPGPLKSDRQL